MDDDAVGCRVDSDHGSQAGGRHPGERPGQAVPEDHVPRVRHRDGRGHVTVCWIDALNHIDIGRPERACPGGVDPADLGVPEPVSAAPLTAARGGHRAGRRVDAAHRPDAAHIARVGDPQRAPRRKLSRRAARRPGWAAR